MSLDQLIRNAVANGKGAEPIGIPHGVVTAGGKQTRTPRKKKKHLTETEKRMAVREVLTMGHQLKDVAERWGVSRQSVGIWVRVEKDARSTRAAHARAEKAKKTQPAAVVETTESPATLLRAVLARFDERLTAVEKSVSRTEGALVEFGKLFK